MDAVRRGFGRILRSEQAAKEILLLDFFARVTIQVTDEIIARGAITVVNGEARGIDGYADAAPGPVEGFAQRNRGLAARCLRNIRLDWVFLGLRDHVVGLLHVGAKEYHQASHHGGIQAWVFLAVLPFVRGAVLRWGFDHLLVADVDLGLATDTFRAGAETFAFAAVEYRVDDGAQRAADPAFR